jgi:2-oxoglutarate/2-oxoacid ferredoxin oxidoreductase subunit alpha
MDEAVDLMGAEGIALDTLRVRAFPFAPEIADFVDAHEKVFVVEQNRDAQLRSLMMIDLELDPKRLTPILQFGGEPITARFIAGEIGKRLKTAAAPVVAPALETAS